MQQEVTSYFTIKSPASGVYKDKGSKFLSFAFPVINEEQTREIIKKLKKEYFDARHHCFAYKIGYQHPVTRVNDDGEPSGTGGKPILGQINSANITNILIVVVRYFGGVLLGTGGLTQAYKLSAADAIKCSQIIESQVLQKYVIHFNFEKLNSVMKIIKDFDIDILNSNFDVNYSYTIMIKKVNEIIVLHKFESLKIQKIDFIGEE